MAVPSYEQLMRPVLEVLTRDGQLQMQVLVATLAKDLALDESDLSMKLPSGQSLVSSRVAWSVTYLVQAGTVRRPKRGVAEITDRGRELLSEDGPISTSTLHKYPEFQEFRTRSKSTSQSPMAPAIIAQPQDQGSDTAGEHTSTPEEVISRMVSTVHGALMGDLIDRVMELTPIAFEHLVLELLRAMKYGAAGQIESTAESGDAGIDGVISQDPLGLDRIYVQAKRYARDRTVGRPMMQAFVGALHGQQADRGVFMTTCRFTRDALEYADRVGVRVIPIDGDRMAELMVKHEVGVQPGYVATLMKMDEDFFETL